MEAPDNKRAQARGARERFGPAAVGLLTQPHWQRRKSERGDALLRGQIRAVPLSEPCERRKLRGDELPLEQSLGGGLGEAEDVRGQDTEP
jgi:hypothetical protein